MTRSVADDARTGRLFSRLAELDRRMQNGGLEEEWVQSGLQALIEGQGWRGVSDVDGGVDADIPGSPNRWQLDIIHSTSRQLKKFGGGWAKQARQTPLPKQWTPDFLANAARYNLRPGFFPEADITEAFQKKGYTKLSDWFYANVRSGKLKGGNPTKLLKGWCLVDFSVGVNYTDGTQVLPDDPWADLITSIRAQNFIGKEHNTPLSSRFAITWNEWNNYLLGQVATQVRGRITFEHAIEFNFIGNVYDPNRGRFNMSQWFGDSFEYPFRLLGGNRDLGGIAYVGYGMRNSRSGNITSRPLVRFDD